MTQLKLRLRKGDMVKVIAGMHKGKTAKVASVLPKTHAVTLEGIGERKRFVKPSLRSPQGGSRDIHVPIDVSKVALVHPTKPGKTSRVGYVVKKDGVKTRVARQAADKEIK